MMRYATITLLGLMGLWFWLQPSQPYSRTDIEEIAYQLYEIGSVEYFTEVGDPPLFQMVAAGTPLDEAQSCAYRMAFTTRVQDKATEFKRLDADIHFADDYGMQLRNNCDGDGIKGHHDLHDVSALQNVKDIDQNLNALSDANAFGRIIRANDVQKDLEDLMVHFAPAVHALGVHDDAFRPKGIDVDLAQYYHEMITGFKAAQFSTINSCEYWHNIDRAVNAYSDLVYHVQGELTETLSPSEFRLAGRWLAPQTIALQPDDNTVTRPRPDC